jgi:hypothetical protein
MTNYYRIDISECSEQEDGTPAVFNTISQRQPTMAGVIGWIRDRYENIAGVEQDANEGYDEDILTFRFRNSDWSHSPVEAWEQVDYVHVTSVAETDIDIDAYTILTLTIQCSNRADGVA